MDGKILIIEDNEQDQKIIKRFLSRAGVQDIRAAPSGEEGIELAERETPDVIIIDTMLPGMDGFETCRRIKEEKKLPVLVVMMTGRVDAVDADRARKMGADDYCVKTSDCAPLLESVRNFLASAGKAGDEGSVDTGKLKADILRLSRGTTEGDWGQEKTNRGIKTLYKELEKRNQALKELDHLKSKFISTVSHELRTPLTIIRGVMSHIAEGLYGEVNEEQKAKLESGLRNVDRLKDMINELLDVAKLEARQVKLDRRPFNMTDVIREIYGAFLPLAKEKGLRLRADCAADVIEVQADRNRITQVLTNLVGNAVKFTEKGLIELVVETDGGKVICTVRDSGRGIAQEDLPKVFGRFQQFGETNVKGLEGTGLGLSICKEIVEMHQGEIWVESTLGQGTAFTFTIPLLAPAAPDPAPTASGNAG